jgi:dihydroorotate dehydrogenase electron transfer subunit
LTRPRQLLLAEGAGDGIPRIIELAARLSHPLVLLGSEGPFPFRPRPSRIVVLGIPDGVIACMPLLDERGIASRLASRSDLPGCFDGSVTELARKWLENLSAAGLGELEIHACGPPQLLDNAQELGSRFAVPCHACQPPAA